ncbi:hypothetical protein PAAG_07201 [Paracoccidioides lutzii Pb01]|uniref:Gfd2/YDR514C-like C-terminal domain-containing protein n=1 Tax=Paracoccidioides lutzii (strain ATCC MYA-826 / Pb01) TaxID=502779 RepID=C1H8W0_PARBA|nr:hypothetical protein PAAG_07201 [Paracoccidioides lutzii Pb01]EEH36783.2 hypothetical protein PAAG_07201 [Paracoccidioides lutzii Pb01]
MDKIERLKMLFDGDEELLQTDTGLHTALDAVLETCHLSQEHQNNIKPPEVSALNPNKAAGPETGFDEYQASFSRAERKARRKMQNNSKNTNNSFGGTNVDLSVLTFSHHTLVAGGFNKPTSFCPITAVSRFPYEHVRIGDRDRIAKRFFDKGKFWNRFWDIYYIHPPLFISIQPLILVPSHQVQDLIDEINEAFKCQLAIPSDREPGFLISFENDSTPQPQYLGTSRSRDEKAEMESTIPAAPTGHGEPPTGSSVEIDRSFVAFKTKMKAAIDATRRRNRVANEKRQVDRMQKLQDWCRTLKRTQCYLGIHPQRPRDLQAPETIGLPWEEQKRVEREYALACGLVLLPFDVNEPAPFGFASEPIFFCVDVEANERIQQQITEIGISTLDTLDLVGIPPGEGGCNWIAKINSRHFRISEYSHVVNKDFIIGCPDYFEFGKSEWISISTAAQVVDECFQPPYAAHTRRFPQSLPGRKGTHGNNSRYINSQSTPESPVSHIVPKGADILDPIPEYKARARNIIFLGHDTESDLTFLRKLGCQTFTKPTTTAITTSPSSLPHNQTQQTPKPNFLETLDTSVLYRAMKHETEPASLGRILADLGIMGWNLHNGGNDARYTMEAMIGITLKSRLLLDKPIDLDDQSKEGGNVYEGKRKEEVERRVRTGVRDLEGRMWYQCASLDLALDAESLEVDDDGGDDAGSL